MSVDTIGFVLTKEKNIHKIWSEIRKSLVDEMLKDSDSDSQFLLFRNPNYTCPRCEVPDVRGMLVIPFTFAKEVRELHVHIDCDGDYNEYKKGKKIIVSLGMWGSSIRLIETVLKGLSVFGEAHILENDCTDDWRPL